MWQVIGVNSPKSTEFDLIFLTQKAEKWKDDIESLLRKIDTYIIKGRQIRIGEEIKNMWIGVCEAEFDGHIDIVKSIPKRSLPETNLPGMIIIIGKQYMKEERAGFAIETYYPDTRIQYITIAGFPGDTYRATRAIRALIEGDLSNTDRNTYNAYARQEKKQLDKTEELARQLEEQLLTYGDEGQMKYIGMKTILRIDVPFLHLFDENHWFESLKFRTPTGTPTWRTISSKWDDPWTEEFKEELLQKVNAIRPSGGIRYFNILLLGQAAAGKSSFINTCATAIINEDRLVTTNLVYRKASRSLESFPMKTKEGGILPLRLFNCRGLNVEYGIPTEDIRTIVEGHVRSGYKINPVASIDENDPKYRKSPEAKDRMHCVLFVVNAENPSEQLTDHKTEEQLRFVGENLAKQHLPQMVPLCKVDKLRISNTHNLRDIFRSQHVRDTCTKAAKFMQIPLMHVLPMSNYHDENIPTLEKDILALFYLLTMMQKANDFILNLTKDGIPEDFYD